MSIELDERLRRLGEFAISEPPPVQRIAARGQQIQRRRRVLTAALLLLLLVGTVAGVATVLGGGDDRVHVASSHKEVGTELRYLSGYVVPNDASAGTLARVQQALERSAVVEQYVTMPPGWASVRLATDQCRQSSCVPASTDRLPLACAALHTGSFAVQVARVPDAATRLRDGLGGDATLYTNDDVGDVELFMTLAPTRPKRRGSARRSRPTTTSRRTDSSTIRRSTASSRTSIVTNPRSLRRFCPKTSPSRSASTSGRLPHPQPSGTATRGFPASMTP